MHISFKVKIRELNFGGVKVKYFRAPKLKPHHADMSWFRTSKAYGAYANSDLFPAMLELIGKRFFPKGAVFLDDIGPNVSVNQDGFLATVSIDLTHLTERV